MALTFGQPLRELRKKKGLTQRELANQAGIDFTYLSKIENDLPGYRPSEDVIRRLAKVLGADPEELVLLAEKIPKTIQQTMAKNPKAAAFLRDAGTLDEKDWDRILKIVARRKKR
jgi:transcriptional regulator with XRE-family HTH domain